MERNNHDADAAWSEGTEAYRDGVGEDGNPHSPGTIAHEAWSDGWQDGYDDEHEAK